MESLKERLYIAYSRVWGPWMTAFVLSVLLVGGYEYLFAPPAQFPVGNIITIERGASTPEIAQKLSEAHVVAHPSLLQIALRLSGKSDTVQMGDYLFTTPQNMFLVAYRLTVGDYDVPPVQLTFIEGATVRKMATQVAAAFPKISESEFLLLAQPQEGYLFPDTYLFQSSQTVEVIIATMRANFDKKISPLLGDVNASGRSLRDTIVMASIIEKEARTEVDKHLISGILWNRIELGMPLQVDAALETYEHIGFPAIPICNPGLDTIEAAIHPTKTEYLYYLTGHDGLMHYARTYAGHQANLRKYLY